MAALTIPAWLALVFQFTGYYGVPIVLWVFLTRKLQTSWRFIRLGAITWLSALPFIFIVPMLAVSLFSGGTPLQAQIIAAIALSLTAGIVEETWRYLYYRRNPVLRERSSLRAALLTGAGHGGTEALVLGIQYVLIPLGMLLFAAQSLPAYMHDSQAVARFALIAGFSRLTLIGAHIGLTLLVWRAVSERNWRYYALALILHITLDLLAFALPLLLPGTDWLALIPMLVLAGWAVAMLRQAFHPQPPTSIAATAERLVDLSESRP